MESDRLDEHGKIVLCSGKIFDAYCELENGSGDDRDSSSRTVIPVSIYMLKLTDEAEPKCLCAIEPVQRVIGNFSINVKVIITLRFHVVSFNFNISMILGSNSLL